MCQVTSKPLPRETKVRGACAASGNRVGNNSELGVTPMFFNVSELSLRWRETVTDEAAIVSNRKTDQQGCC
jgi:hypothetical protein